MEIINGATYRVTAVPAWEYLTVGRVYRASVEGFSVGLHNTVTGAGTYVKRQYIDDGRIALERVYGPTDIEGMVFMEPQPSRAQIAMLMPTSPGEGYSPYVDAAGLWYWRKLASDLVSLPVQQY